jgi:hypothetical protein
MQTPVEQFTSHLDQLVLWLNQHGGKVPIPSLERQRLRSVLDRIMAGAPASVEEEKLGKLAEQRISEQRKHEQRIREKDIPRQATIPSFKATSSLVKCSNCGASVSPKNLRKHQRKCRTYVSPAKGTKRTGRNEAAIDTAQLKLYAQSIKDERRLDGTAGGHVWRESGRYGSHSSHDDYGEEGHL